jgi:hypothetical protein
MDKILAFMRMLHFLEMSIFLEPSFNRFYFHLHNCYQHAHAKVDWIVELRQVKAVVDPQQLESEAAGVRSTSNKQVTNNPMANHQTRGPVAEPSSTPTVGPLSKVPRFWALLNPLVEGNNCASPLIQQIHAYCIHVYHLLLKLENL